MPKLKLPPKYRVRGIEKKTAQWKILSHHQGRFQALQGIKRLLLNDDYVIIKLEVVDPMTAGYVLHSIHTKD